jgi:hypothetical protein
MHGELEGFIETISYFNAPRFLVEKIDSYVHYSFLSEILRIFER